MWLFLFPSVVISSNRENKHAGKISKKSCSRWKVFFILTLTWLCLVGLAESPGCVFWKVKLSIHPTPSWRNITWNVFPLKTWEKRHTIYLSKDEKKSIFTPSKASLLPLGTERTFYTLCSTLTGTVWRLGETCSDGGNIYVFVCGRRCLGATAWQKKKMKATLKVMKSPPPQSARQINK